MTVCPLCDAELDLQRTPISRDIGHCPDCGHSFIVQSGAAPAVATDGGEADAE